MSKRNSSPWPSPAKKGRTACLGGVTKSPGNGDADRELCGTSGLRASPSVTVVMRTSLGIRSGAVSVVGVRSATVLWVTEESGLMGSWPSRIEDRRLFGLLSDQPRNRIRTSIHIHMRLPAVDITRYAILYTVATRQALRGSITSHLSVVTSDASNGRAFALSFDSCFIHLCPAQLPPRAQLNNTLPR